MTGSLVAPPTGQSGASEQTRRNRSIAGRKAASASKLRRARLAEGKLPWPNMTTRERGEALRIAFAGGAPVDPGVTRGTAPVVFSIADVLARVRKAVERGGS